MNKLLTLLGSILAIYYTKVLIDFFFVLKKLSIIVGRDFSWDMYLIKNWSLTLIVLISVLGSVFTLMNRKIGVYLLNALMCTSLLLTLIRPTYWYINVLFIILIGVYFVVFFRFQGLEKFRMKMKSFLGSLVIGLIIGLLLIIT